jgi:hypothetical protein
MHYRQIFRDRTAVIIDTLSVQTLDRDGNCLFQSLSIILLEDDGQYNRLCQDNKVVTVSISPVIALKSPFYNSSFAFRTQEWFNLARDNVLRMRRSAPLVTLKKTSKGLTALYKPRSLHHDSWSLNRVKKEFFCITWTYVHNFCNSLLYFKHTMFQKRILSPCTARSSLLAIYFTFNPLNTSANYMYHLLW